MPESPAEQEFSAFARSVGIPDGTRVSGKALEQLQGAFMSFKSKQAPQSTAAAPTDLDIANTELARQRGLTVEADRNAAANAGPDFGNTDFGLALESLQARGKRSAADRRDVAGTQFFNQKAGNSKSDQQVKQRVDFLTATADRQQKNAAEFARLVEFFSTNTEGRAENPELAKAAQKQLDGINARLTRTLGQLTNINEALEKVRARGGAPLAPAGANGKAKRACDPNKMVTRIVKTTGGRDRLGNKLVVGSTIQVNECVAFEMEESGDVDPPNDGDGGGVVHINDPPGINPIFTPGEPPPPKIPPAIPESAPPFEAKHFGADGKADSTPSPTQAQRRGARLRRLSAPPTGK